MTACRWLCTTMVALVFWIASTRSDCTCCHLHCCDIFKMRERNQSTFNWNEIMNGNQGDHVTFVSTWRRSKQRLSFCRTFQPFIQPRCRAQWQTYHEAPTSHFLNRRVGIHGLPGFEFAVVGQLCTQNVTHACLFTNVRTHAQHIQSPRPVENLTGVGQCS